MKNHGPMSMLMFTETCFQDVRNNTHCNNFLCRSLAIASQGGGFRVTPELAVLIWLLNSWKLNLAQVGTIVVASLGSQSAGI